MSDKKPLSPEEKKLLGQLLSRYDFPKEGNEDPEIFHGLLSATTSSPVELAVFDREGRILLFYRKDWEYDGEHMCGSVNRDKDTVQRTLDRIVRSEVVGGSVTPPIDLGWMEISKGTGEGENPTRHEISLLHACYLVGEYAGPGKFYDPKNLPANTLTHHKAIIAEILRRLARRDDAENKFVMGYN